MRPCASRSLGTATLVLLAHFAALPTMAYEGASDEKIVCEVTTSTTAGAFASARRSASGRSAARSTRSPCAPSARAIAA